MAWRPLYHQCKPGWSHEPSTSAGMCHTSTDWSHYLYVDHVYGLQPSEAVMVSRSQGPATLEIRTDRPICATQCAPNYPPSNTIILDHQPTMYRFEITPPRSGREKAVGYQARTSSSPTSAIIQTESDLEHSKCAMNPYLLEIPPDLQAARIQNVEASTTGVTSDETSMTAPVSKPVCWEHGCNGRPFSTTSNLMRHQREKSGLMAKVPCPHCGIEYTRRSARDLHISRGKCRKLPDVTSE